MAEFRLRKAGGGSVLGGPDTLRADSPGPPQTLVLGPVDSAAEVYAAIVSDDSTIVVGFVASPAVVYAPVAALPAGLRLGMVGSRPAVFAPGVFGPPTLTNAQQVIALPGVVAGTRTLTFSGQITAPIAYNASAAVIQAALEALANIAPGDVVVSMGPWPGAVVVTFTGVYAGVAVPLLVIGGGSGVVSLARPGGFVKPRITVQAMSRAAPNTVLAELTMSRERNWLPELNDVGQATVTLRHGDPATDVVAYYDLLRFSLDEQVRFTSVVRKRRRMILAPGEEAAQGTVLSGPGVLSLLVDGIVHPYGGVTSRITADRRVFNFASLDFDDTGWDTDAVETGTMFTDNANNPIAPFPTGKPGRWPDRSAKLIWDRYVGYGMVPAGDCYFRSTFTTDHDLQAEVWGAADDAYELWIDGQLIVSDMATGVYLGQSSSNRIFLPAGTHLLAMLGRNTTPNLKAGVWWSVLELDNGGAIVNTLTRSASGNGTPEASTTRILAYPAAPPGFTPGHVIRLLLAEAQARGACGGITLGFSDTADSAGVAWPVTADIAFTLGLDLLAVVKQLAESYFDVVMSPTLRLDCWGTKGTAVGVPLVGGAPGANLTELTHEGVV